jgi:hypothetical protein
MDNGWIGGKLSKASHALAERYSELTQQTGEARLLVLSVAPQLLREIGQSLMRNEADSRVPWSRTNGMLRLSLQLDESELVRAWNVLAALVSSYVVALPGATVRMDRFARDAVRHAARVTLQLRRELLQGERRLATERQFGGVALLVFHPRSHSPVSGPTRRRSYSTAVEPAEVRPA